jgi:PAS domain S-box-containing protein
MKPKAAANDQPSLGTSRAISTPATAPNGSAPSAHLLLDEVESVAQIGSYLLDIAAGRWASSKGLDAIFGIDATFNRSVEGWASLIHSADREGMLTYLADEVLGRARPFDKEYRIVRADTGAERWVHGRGVLELDAARRPLRLVGTISDVTEARAAREALIASELRYATIFESTAEAILIAEVATKRLRWVNSAACTLLGNTRDELLELMVDDIHPPQDPLTAPDRFGGIVDGHVTESKAVPTVRKDGTILLADIKATAVVMDGVPCNVGFFTDVTERVAAEEERARLEDGLRRSERNLTEAQRIAHVGSWERDVTTGALHWSVESHRIFGIAPGTFPGTLEAYLAFVHPDDRLKAAPSRSELEAGDPGATEYRIIRADGAVRILHEEAEVVRDSTGAPVRFVGSTQDITERVAAEEERARLEDGLRRSERNLAEAQRIAHIGSWEWDLATDFAQRSEELHRIYGVEPGTIPTTTEAFLNFVHPDDRARVQASERAAISVSGTFALEYRVVRPDGTTRIVHDEAAIVRDSSGVPVRMFGTIQDVTERFAAEEERARLVSAIEQAADSIWIHHLDGTIAYANPSFARIYGYEPGEVVGRSMAILDSGRHEPAFWSELWASVRAGRTWSGSIVNRRKDGTLIEVEKVVSALRDADGRLTGFVQSDRDVTRERALEAQLEQSQKMEEIGQLAGGIAHDFNNLVTAIRGYGELVRTALPAGDQHTRADIDEVIANADRAAELTRQLLAFSRRQVLRPQVVDPAGIVEGIAPLLRRLLGAQVELTSASQPGLGRVKVDPAQLEQVIVNLAVNARDAMPGGGRLRIQTAEVELDAAFARVHPEVTPGRFVALAVSDTGTGMDPAIVAHIFEPFFTTKPVGEGTGLGLATVYGIVKQSDGIITVESDPGRGSTFTIYLPLVIDEPAAVAEARALLPPSSGTETILLVDDEPAVREFASRVLADHGYMVLDAPDAEAALALAAIHPGPIELLLTDVVMPGVGGPELAERLVGERPGIRVLFTSGYPESPAGRSDALSADAPFLPKPFTTKTLTRSVRDVLGAERRPGPHDRSSPARD